MTLSIAYRAALAALVLAAIGLPAAAQYDRDGRYVPSPMGVPRDPYASTVPGYSGTPGGTRGTPTIPRGMISPPASIVEPLPPVLQNRGDPPVRWSDSTPLWPTAKQCARGWSAKTGIPRVEFNRKCRRMRATR